MKMRVNRQWLCVWGMSLLATAVGLTSWTGCEGAPEPKVHKERPDTGPVDTPAAALWTDGSSPESEAGPVEPEDAGQDDD